MTMRPSRTVQSQAAGASGLPSALVRPVTRPSKTTTPPASWILSIRNANSSKMMTRRENADEDDRQGAGVTRHGREHRGQRGEGDDDA